MVPNIVDNQFGSLNSRLKSFTQNDRGLLVALANGDLKLKHILQFNENKSL